MSRLTRLLPAAHSHPPRVLACGALALMLGTATFAALPLDAHAATASGAGAATEHAHRPAGIAWHDGDVDSALALAQREHRPLFVYWGAVWCPPCNQLKATLFKRPDFQERSRLFVPVYIDGDEPGAQQLGSRFKVRGYPTMIVLRPDGTELTRLPGEVDPQRYLDVLGAALATTHPVADIVNAARAGTRTLSASEWRLLAYYSWETDEQQVVAPDQLGATLAALAARCPASEADSRERLLLKALSMTADLLDKHAPGAAALPADLQTHAMATVQHALADENAARRQFDVLVYGADVVVKQARARDAAAGQALQAQWDSALVRLAQDPQLSTADRVAATDARVSLARIDTPQGALSDALLTDVRAAAAWADRSAKDATERQSVISAAAGLLTSAGLLDESDALLRAELKRAHSPYYFMLGLADNAKRRGDTRTALDWYARAHADAKGPATRLQWGASHARAVMDMAPDDAPQVERVTLSVLNEVAPLPASFEGRNRAALERLGKKLGSWSQLGDNASTAARIRAQWQSTCAKLPADAPQRKICQDIL